MIDYEKKSYALALRAKAIERKLREEVDPESEEFDRLLEKLQALGRELEAAAWAERKAIAERMYPFLYRPGDKRPVKRNQW